MRRGQGGRACGVVELNALRFAETPAKQAFSGLRVEDRDAACAACHAGGRGFESRRSRFLKCLQIGTLRCPIRIETSLRGPIAARCLCSKMPGNWHFATELVIRWHKQNRVSGLSPAGSLPSQTNARCSIEPGTTRSLARSGTASRSQRLIRRLSPRRDSRKPRWPLSTGATALRRSLTGLFRAPCAMRRVLGAVGVRARAGEDVRGSAPLGSFGAP
jgi:hypothetical protein